MGFMLEVTHRRFAKEIAKVLKLSKRESDLLEIGSIHPDSWADFPHHKGKEKEIAENILIARKFYLQNDDEYFFRLGVVLHYIADSWTLRPRISEKHTEWEKQIEKAPILDDSQLEEAIKNLTMPSKEVETYLTLLPILKGLVQNSLIIIDLEKSDGMQLEEAAAQELIRLRGYKPIKREECAIKELSPSDFEDLDKFVRHIVRMTGPSSLHPLNIISFMAIIPEDKRNVLIWCVLTQRIIGDWLVRRMKRAMEKTGIERGIMITSGRFTEEARAVMYHWPFFTLMIVANDLCIDTDQPIPRRLSTWSAPIIDLNFAYRICLEVARLIIS